MADNNTRSLTMATFQDMKNAYDKQRLTEKREREKQREEDVIAKHQAKLDKQKADHAANIEACGGEEAYAEIIRQKEITQFEKYVAKQEEKDKISVEIRAIVAWIKNAGRTNKGRDLTGAVVRITQGQCVGNIGFVVSSNINISGNHIDDIFTVRVASHEYTKLKTEFSFVRDSKILDERIEELRKMRNDIK